MTGNIRFGIILVGVIAVIVYMSTFIVHERELAIKFKLGEIVQADYEPGIYLQIPIINNVKKFDNRIQTLDARPQRFLTLEKKDVIVDSFAKWRIANVAQYFRSTGGSEAKTGRLLAEHCVGSQHLGFAIGRIHGPLFSRWSSASHNASSDCEITRTPAVTGMKLESPGHRGTRCQCKCPGTPAPAAAPRLRPMLKPEAWIASRNNCVNEVNWPSESSRSAAVSSASSAT